MIADPADRPPHLRQLLRVRAFAALYLAEVQSVAGDQLARVALSVLVFEHTNNAAATALTYAATFLPAVFGGFVLGGAGDRYPLRAVLIACDLVRVAAFATMAVPAVPLPAVIALLVVAIFVGPAHTASQVSYLAQALPAEQFRAATGIRLATNQAAQVVGFGFGGGIVAVIGPRAALLLDAVTFVLAAAVKAALVAPLPVIAPVTVPDAGAAAGQGVRVRAVRQDRILRTAVGLCWLQGFFVVPEGLAVPFAGALGVGPTSAGLLLAALPFGGAVGALLVTRHVRAPARRPVSRVMAVATGLPLVLSALHLPLPAVLLAWTVSGAMSSYLLEVMSEIVQAVPAASRARVVGRISAGLVTAQGVGLAVFGVLAQTGGVRAAVAWAGGVGVLIAAALAVIERLPRRGAVEPQDDGVMRSRGCTPGTS